MRPSRAGHIHVHRDEAGAPIANGQASLLKREKTPADFERGFIEATVDGVTLDAFFADQYFTSAGMWVDVEGACGLVLPGARDLLAQTAVLMIEVEEQQFWGAEHWLREQVISYLSTSAWSLWPGTSSTGTSNIVFVRAELLAGPNGSTTRRRGSCPAHIRRRQTGHAEASNPPTPGAATWKRKAWKRIGAAGRAARRILARARPGEGVSPNAAAVFEG